MLRFLVLCLAAAARADSSGIGFGAGQTAAWIETLEAAQPGSADWLFERGAGRVSHATVDATRQSAEAARLGVADAATVRRGAGVPAPEAGSVPPPALPLTIPLLLLWPIMPRGAW